MYRKGEKEKDERTYMQVDGERRENTGARGENEKNCKRGDFKPAPHLQMFGSRSLIKGVDEFISEYCGEVRRCLISGLVICMLMGKMCLFVTIKR